jgi:hypothetical protein
MKGHPEKRYARHLDFNGPRFFTAAAMPCGLFLSDKFR